MLPEIRPFRNEDAAALAALFFDAVRIAGRQHYSQAQVEAWAPAPPDPSAYVKKAADGRLMLLALDPAGAPGAYADLESDGHIDHLFCRPDLVGQGVASALCDALEAAARRQGIARLYVEASEGARPLFLRKGFSVIERRDFEVRGVPIHNYAMEKRL
jgi:putative acetyltransferase